MTGPQMKITYQTPLGGDGKGISFELAVDAKIDKGALDILLDIPIEAARRQWAIEQLPNVKADLFVNKKLLADQRKGRAAALARQQENVLRFNVNRRREGQPLPADEAAVAQFDARIMDIQGHIEAAYKRIPHLEAIIRGETPPELFDEDDDAEREAAD